MSRRETIVLLIMVAALIIINVVGYIRRQNFKRNYQVIVEESAVRISINYASVDKLTDLPGIGPSIAARIIEYREKCGGFQRLSDLKEVKGIGEKLFQKILPYIKL